MKLSRIALIAAMALGTTASITNAGDENGNFMVRLQGTYLATQDKTTSTFLGATDLTATHGARVSNEVLPTATLTYFFNKNLAAELFCCFGKVQTDLLVGGVNQGQVADTWMFPPIVTLQYHMTGLGAFKPYVGAGVQYIHYFSSKTPTANPLGVTAVDFSDSFGPAIQAGFDYHLGHGWYLNADVKKSWLKTKVTFDNDVVVKQKVDPLTVSLGIGYRFNLEDLFGGRRASYDTLK